MPPTPETIERRQRILIGLTGRSLEQAVAIKPLWDDIKAEAASAEPDAIVPPDLVRVLEQARAVRERQPHLELFFSTDDVMIVPGFMGSQLDDVTGPYGLIWIDPKLLVDARELLQLALKAYQPTKPDEDAADGVTIRPNGGVPLLYGGLKYDLEIRRYS